MRPWRSDTWRKVCNTSTMMTRPRKRYTADKEEGQWIRMGLRSAGQGPVLLTVCHHQVPSSPVTSTL